MAVLLIAAAACQPPSGRIEGTRSPAVVPSSGSSQPAPAPVGSQAPTRSPDPAVARSSSTGDRPGGTVGFQLDGRPTTTAVNIVDGGAAISGAAVTDVGKGIHRVRLECAARDGDTWAVAGTTEATTVHGERAGDWSAVIVREGSPQLIAIWLSDAKSPGADCAQWLRGIDIASIDSENFHRAESGMLVPPAAGGS